MRRRPARDTGYRRNVPLPLLTRVTSFSRFPPMAEPYPKSKQLARGERRYRRKVASPKQWAALRDAKLTSCRLTGAGCLSPRAIVHLHHVVSRAALGDDTADNLVPLCADCHGRVTQRDEIALRALAAALTDAEVAYCVSKLGEGAKGRLFGI